MSAAGKSIRLYRIFIGTRPGTRSASIGGRAGTRRKEQQELARLARIMGRYFRSYTVTPAQGYWDGRPERARVIWVTADRGNRQKGAGAGAIEACLSDLKRAFRQEVLLLERAGECRLF